RGRIWRSRTVLTLAALWAGYATGHLLLSGRWWPLLIPDVAPPIVFVAVPPFLLLAAAAIRRLRRHVVACVVLALAAGCPSAGLRPAALWARGDGPAPAGAPHVVSWNPEYWDQADDPDRFYAFLKAQRADVYLIQEFLYMMPSGPRPVPDLDRLRREFSGYHIATVGELLTLSRFPIVAEYPLDAGALPPDGNDWHDYWPNKILRTDLRMAGRTLSVYNVHIPVQFDTGSSPLSPAFYRVVRESNARRQPQLRALARDVADNHNPVLVSGDFNSSPAMGDMRGLPDGLHDALRASTSLYPRSWPVAGLPMLWRLDWTFTTADVRVHRYQFGDPQRFSDHRTQDMVISLRKEPR
ncbi:MAG: endonuclease/exonuclease/phosphatase family protein, partial [Dactylosporangium sp.]|nr:endonuclease/exonuclease/phosphatase family protein [Dactylosporangium sp.]NNJ60562.1 endonuclease/exonuclease/phosphatase family protein [Dactylosporangium sp.]